MKRIGLKIAFAAFVFAAGTWGSFAQQGTGSACLSTGPGFSGSAAGTCVNTQLTEEQKEILHELFVAYQAEMSVLRAEMRATRNFAEKRAIWAKMSALREAHFAEVRELLKEWGIGG